ncbi:heterokaryon incompatibility protein-domain-containing protein [Xylariaceae sp. FL0016]|nr:heterokaryon incompatibility protein-domain-containing protein [Xylariaceae sp. FL0016]
MCADCYYATMENEETGVQIEPDWQQPLFAHNSRYYDGSLVGDPSVRRIRLLKLLPGQFQERILCTLTTEVLTPDSSYEAVSYTWGEYPSIHSITINGMPEFQVAYNVFSVLKRIRRRDSARVVWVDAICIKQDDLDERSNQVSFMRDIYSYAQMVLIWLGPCGATALGELEAEDCDDHGINRKEGHKFFGTSFEIQCRTSKWFHNDERQGKWWERAWTLQEYCVAKHTCVLIGPHVYPYNDVERAAFFAIENKSFHTGKIPDVSYPLRSRSILRGVIEVEPPRSMLGSLTFADDNKATDPRDRIFALLGLMASDTHKIKIDYRLPFEEVCIQTTFCILEQEKNLNLLLQPWPGLPDSKYSWVKDFSQPAPPSWQNSQGPKPDWGWQAPGDIIQPCYRVDAGNFSVTGVFLTTVEVPIPLESVHQGASLEDMAASIEPCKRAVDTFYGRFPGKYDYKLDFQRTLVCDNDSHLHTRDIWKGERDPVSADNFDSHAFRRFMGTSSYLQSAKSTLTGRCFFIAQDGRLGIANTSHVRYGDQIVLINGLDMPAILRRTHQPHHYHWVAEAYIHGVMYGEMNNCYKDGRNGLGDLTLD